MIRRTIFEWSYLPVEPPAPGAFTRAHADRLLAVAKTSPLGGRDGVRILTDHHHKLRGQQVVGVIASEGCTLEILPKIESLGTGDQTSGQGRIRRQLVHMLAVALDLDITGGNLTELDWQREDLLEIIIRLFSRKLADAVRQGMPRHYVEEEEDLPALRGRLRPLRQFTRLLASPQLLACRFDALSSDTALNRIMKAAIERLVRVSRSAENQRRLRELAFAYADVAQLPVSALPWSEVVLDRTNARWGQLLSLAKLLLGARFQSTSEGQGRGFSLLFEMNTLFEEYIGRMLARSLSGSGFTVHLQSGRLFCLEDEESGKPRFQTRPDILVKRLDRIAMVIDTKWKSLSSNAEDPKQGISQSDVYQMMAYGRLYACSRLMLLYPHNPRLGASPAISRHRIVGSEDRLSVASVEVASHVEAIRCLASLLEPLRNSMALPA
ncbi:MAG: 5-methylcytosine-specific restriction enzyme subunit McrC [Sphingomonadales bacterium]|nr:5-methylcytosine-specific restriction enzyme subunit McrC [Sphingomonadales bacterium]